MSTLSDKICASILADEWAVQKYIRGGWEVYECAYNGLALNFTHHCDYNYRRVCTVTASWADEDEKAAMVAAHTELLAIKAETARTDSRKRFEAMFL